MAEKTSTTTKTELRPLEVGVGAAAAVVTAFATSYLGTAGTLTGAALASIVGTVSTSLLRSSAQRTNESLQRTTSRLRQTMAGPQLGGGGSTAVDPGVAAVDEAELAAAGVPPAGERPADEQPALAGTRLGRIPRPAWAVLAAGAVAAFVVALVAITGIEAAVGKPLATLIGNEKGGGTTVGRTVGSEPATDQPGTPTPTPTATEESSPSGSPSPTGDTSPTVGPSESAAPQPTGEPTPAPSVTEPAPTP
jgi:hypothetical protein